MFKKKRRRKVELILRNDDYNSFISVINGLKNYLPNCSSIRAEQIANIVHNNGQCQIYTGFGPDVYLIQSQLIKRGLLVEAKTIKK
jgi:ATP-dependent Clp protease adapter protein ClpS